MPQSIIDLVDQQIQRAELGKRRLMQEGVSSDEAGKPVITISRQLGSGGRQVAEILAEILSFSLWDGELVENIAEDANIAKYLVAEFDEQVVSEIDVLLRHLVGEPKIGGFQYKRHLTRTILQIARIGNAIILGRGGNFVLPHALNVRIIASREIRLHNMIQFENMKSDDALRLIDESDRARADFTRRIWGRDWAVPLFYDIVLRMDEFTNEAAAAAIAAILKARLEIR